MTFDPNDSEPNAEELTPGGIGSPCVVARGWLQRAREEFAAGDVVATCVMARVAALYAKREIARAKSVDREEAVGIEKECGALEAAARKSAPERIAKWERERMEELERTAVEHLQHLQQADQALREAKLAGLRSVAERMRRRRAEWLLGRGLQELLDRNTLAPDRFFSPAHEAARAALRSLLETRARPTQSEDEAWRANPPWDEPATRRAAVQLVPPAAPASRPPSPAVGPLEPHAEDLHFCAWQLGDALERLERAGDNVMLGYDACDLARYRAQQLRSSSAATEAHLQRAQDVMRVILAWLARRSVAAGPTLEEWRALRTRMYAAQLDAQIVTMERLAAELRSLSREEAKRRQKLAERALSRKESSIASGTMPPMLFESPRYVAAEEALERAWLERVQLPA